MPNQPAGWQNAFTGKAMKQRSNAAPGPFISSSDEARRVLSTLTPEGPPASVGKFGQFKAPPLLPAGAASPAQKLPAPTRGMLETLPGLKAQTPHWGQKAPVWKGEGPPPGTENYTEPGFPADYTKVGQYWDTESSEPTDTQKQIEQWAAELWGPSGTEQWDTMQANALNQVSQQAALDRMRLAEQMAARGMGASGQFLQGSQLLAGQEQTAKGQVLADIANKRLLYDYQRKLAALDAMKSLVGPETQKEIAMIEAQYKNKMADIMAFQAASEAYGQGATIYDEGAQLAPREWRDLLTALGGLG